VRDAADSVRRNDDAMRGRLRVSVPPLQSASFHAMVNAFVVRHPQVSLQIHVSAQRVDLVGGGYDLALRAGGAFDPGLVVRMLARSRSIAVASPEYLARRGTPKRARDLRDHTCILGFERGEVVNHYWPLRSGSTVRIDGPLATNQLEGVLAAVSAGIGIGMLPLFLAAPAMRSGALTSVLHGVLGGPIHIGVVYPERELVPAPMRAFIDELVAWGRTEFVALGELETQCKEHEDARATARAGGKRTKRRG
jgi:DNA-binding transcriptional LysR family regulator